MLKAVIDTNVFISGLLKGSNSRQIIKLLQDSRFILVISPEILDELIGVISRPKFHNVITREAAEKLIEIIKTQALFVKSRQKFNIIKDDPEDDKFLEAAFEARADFIVSGDRHLLALKNFHNIPVISLQEFLKRLKLKKD
jgi:putative PIN family toxin of toxin-antitoxin system